MKIILAPTDVNLTNVLAKYLCPLLLKLSSPHVDSRRKTEEICDMLDNRLQYKSSLKLPTADLLSQFRNPVHPKALKDRTLSYLVRALQHNKCEAAIFSSLTTGFADLPYDHQSIIFNTLCQQLSKFPTANSAMERQTVTSAYTISLGRDEAAFSLRLLHMMFLDIRQTHHDHPATQLSTSSRKPLTPTEAAFLCPQNGHQYSVSSLNEAKKGILRFITLPVIHVAWRFVISLVASFDLNHEIQSPASVIMRQCDLSTDDSLYVDLLYDLSNNRNWLDQRLYVRTLQLLGKSKAAASRPILAQQCVARGLACT